ncbi:MAG TPA: hypothetical protein DEO84_08870 [candidate division Zixibacteria bacterium]|nr:hypothetical protein [candidate division Zixibacteria bacterium]
MPITFTELCDAFTRARQSYLDYREESFQLAEKIYHEMISYLGCSENDLKLVPDKEDYDDTLTYTPAGASCLGDDSFWHIGFILQLKATNCEGPFESVRFAILFRKTPNGYSTKIASKATEFNIIFDDPSTFNVLFDDLFIHIKESYDVGFKDFLSTGKAPHNIGFDIGNLRDNMRCRILRQNH